MRVELGSEGEGVHCAVPVLILSLKPLPLSPLNGWSHDNCL